MKTVEFSVYFKQFQVIFILYKRQLQSVAQNDSMRKAETFSVLDVTQPVSLGVHLLKQKHVHFEHDCFLH